MFKEHTGTRQSPEITSKLQIAMPQIAKLKSPNRYRYLFLLNNLKISRNGRTK